MPTNDTKYMKQYYMSNPEKWEIYKSPVECLDCKCVIKRYNLSKHKKSFKHLRATGVLPPKRSKEQKLMDKIKELESELTDLKVNK